MLLGEFIAQNIRSHGGQNNKVWKNFFGKPENKMTYTRRKKAWAPLTEYNTHFIPFVY